MDKAKSLLKFVVELGEAIDKAVEDKKIGFEDLPLLIAPLMAAGQAFSDIKGAIQQFRDADQAQLDDLAEFVEVELDLQSDRTEGLIEDAFELALRLYSIVEAFRK